MQRLRRETRAAGRESSRASVPGASRNRFAARMCRALAKAASSSIASAACRVAAATAPASGSRPSANRHSALDARNRITSSADTPEPPHAAWISSSARSGRPRAKDAWTMIHRSGPSHPQSRVLASAQRAVSSASARRPQESCATALQLELAAAWISRAGECQCLVDQEQRHGGCPGCEGDCGSQEPVDQEVAGRWRRDQSSDRSCPRARSSSRSRTVAAMCSQDAPGLTSITGSGQSSPDPSTACGKGRAVAVSGPDNQQANAMRAGTFAEVPARIPYVGGPELLVPTRWAAPPPTP